MAWGSLAGATSLAATIVALAAMAPSANALSITCLPAPTVDDEAEVQVVGTDTERTRTVIGYKASNEKVFVRMRDVVAPDEILLPCGPEPGGWDIVVAEFGDLGDRIRVDGKGLTKRFANPLPPSIAVHAFGGDGDDELRGHAGFDRFNGGGGDDLMITGRGHDHVLALDDEIDEIDEVKAGPGADDVLADDGVQDDINCGPGFDYVDAGVSDQLTSCEVVE